MGAGEGRLVARLAAAILERLEECSLLAKDVTAGRDKDLDFEAKIAAENLLPHEALPARICQSPFKGLALGAVFMANVENALGGPGHEAGQDHSFEHEMR